MSKIVQKTYTIDDLHPTGYTGATNLTSSSSYPYSNGQNSTSNTSTYAQIQASSTNTDGYIYYTFTIPTIPADATINSVTAAFRARFSNSSGVTGSAQLYTSTTAMGSSTSISGTTSTVYNISSTGTWTVTQIRNLRLRVNTRRTSNNRRIYFYGADVTITYTIDETVYEIDVTASSGGTVSPISGEADAGSDYVINFVHELEDTKPYQVLDNNVDVTNQLVKASGQASSCTVTTASGASYGFSQSGDSWVSNNTGVNSSAAVSIITLTIRNNATVTIDAAASSEADYDYGYLSEIGETFSTSASAESSYKWRGAGTEYGTVNYGTLSPGTYQIYAKYYKDQYTAGNDDTFTFKVNISETITSEGYNYTINDVQADHEIVAYFYAPVFWTVSGTVDSHISISPSLPDDFAQGSDAVFTLTPSQPGTITVVDNGNITAEYIIPINDLSSVEYTITEIDDDHVLNIQYEPLAQFTVSATYIETGLTISPTLPQTIWEGSSLTITITPNTIGQITIIDNGSESAIYYITPGDIHNVEYLLDTIVVDHELEFKFSALPEYTATATLTGTGSLNPNSVTDYAGSTATFTVTGVPLSNILIIRNNGKNVSAQATQSGTTYTYSFVLIRDCVIEFVSKIPENVTVTATVDQDATVDPTSTTVLEGNEYTLVITPDDFETAPISVSDNYEEVIESIVAKKDSEDLQFTAESETHGSINSGTSYLSYCIGRTAENPYSTTNNAYSSGSSVTGYAIYSFDVSRIPSDAVITGVQCAVNGHLESSTVSSNRFCRVQLYSNSTAKGTVQTFPSTSNTTMELEDVGTWTRAEVENIKLRMEVGYYGGLVCGITLTISYEIDKIRYYYTTTIYEATNISVKYKPDFFIKIDNTWIGLTLTALRPKISDDHKFIKSLYVKINNKWVSVD